MFGKAWATRVLGAVTLIASAAGCNLRPRVVIRNLPVDAIAEASGAGQRGGRPGRKVPPAKPAKPAAERPKPPPGWVPRVFARPWRWIVIHHSATDVGSAAIFDRAHRARGWDELGYHFVINNGRGAGDGAVEVGSRWAKQKWGAHCKTPDNAYNDYGIGVCVVGNLTRKLPSPAQLRGLRKLVFFLSDRYHIEPDHLIGHRDAPGTATRCPGKALHRSVHKVLRPELARRRRARGQ